jgi:hypothetical protein
LSYVIRPPTFEELKSIIESELGVKILEYGITPEGYFFRFERDLTAEEEARLAAIVNNYVVKLGSPTVRAKPTDALVQKIIDELEFDVKIDPRTGRGRVVPKRRVKQ